MRTHISLPDDLVEEIDRVAGRRRRSDFIEEAVRLKLMNERQKRALEALAASPIPEAGMPPNWASRKKAERWLRESRERDSTRLERLLEDD